MSAPPTRSGRRHDAATSDGPITISGPAGHDGATSVNARTGGLESDEMERGQRSSHETH